MTNKNWWFKRKRYGYGWVPVTWQGWLTVAIFVAVISVPAAFIEYQKTESVLWMSLYLIFVLVVSLALVIISYRKGPKPKWRWGSSDEDDPDEDY